ncbi:hypothetical protein [Paracoccus versutus]
MAALALGGACVACCTLPLAAGFGIFAAAGGAAYVGGALGITAAAVAGTIAWYVLRRRQSKVCPPPNLRAGACGCGPSSTKLDEHEASDEAIACTLLADDFKSRAAWIRGIAERHLKKVQRSPLTLYLIYGSEAAGDVREMVRKEQECCAFLRFDLSINEDAVHLLITAPEAAREAADMLFEHFAPDLASVEAA